MIPYRQKRGLSIASVNPNESMPSRITNISPQDPYVRRRMTVLKSSRRFWICYTYERDNYQQKRFYHGSCGYRFKSPLENRTGYYQAFDSLEQWPWSLELNRCQIWWWFWWAFSFLLKMDDGGGLERWWFFIFPPNQELSLESDHHVFFYDFLSQRIGNGTLFHATVRFKDAIMIWKSPRNSLAIWVWFLVSKRRSIGHISNQ